MTCVECTRGTVAFRVPERFRDCLPENAGAAAICRSCLTLQPPAPDEPIEEAPDLSALSDGFPADPDAGVALALAVGLLESLALNRSQIERLVEHVERQGQDPMLAFERLADDPNLDPAVDLRGRRRQLEQLID